MSIRWKLLAVYLLPSLAVVGVLAYAAHEIARFSLEAEMERRLVAVAAAVAAQMDPTLVAGVEDAAREQDRAGPVRDPDLDPRKTRTYANLRARLERAARATGFRRIGIVSADLRNLVDLANTPVGELQVNRARDRAELRELAETGLPRASLQFRGRDGQRYKTGYAPIYVTSPATISGPTRGPLAGVLYVDGPVEFFDVLEDLRRSLGIAAAVLAATLLLVSLGIAAGLTRPIARLAHAAAAIGRGELGQPIEVRGRDEVARLGQTLEEMRGALSARDRQMQMMLSGIAHEVRNPLGGIELYTGLLREGLPTDDPRAAQVRKIERELFHLKRVVEDFLDYARNVPLSLEPEKTAALLEEIVALVHGEAAERKVELRLEVDTPAEELRCDADRLKRVLLNLLKNALQATPAGGSVTLRASLAPGGVRIVVEDTGSGIPPEILREIFTPFFTTKAKGTGLGLAFAKKIVEQHGGTIDVKSEVGQGTQVALLIPGQN